MEDKRDCGGAEARRVWKTEFPKVYTREAFGPHEAAMSDCLEEVFVIRLMKHHDYGAKPILRRGEQGVVDRLYDKLDRLSSILAKGETRVKDESRRDTWRDIAAYGIIGMMLEEGTFSLPAGWEMGDD